LVPSPDRLVEVRVLPPGAGEAVEIRVEAARRLGHAGFPDQRVPENRVETLAFRGGLAPERPVDVLGNGSHRVLKRGARA
jgi:hypothetical protein